MKKSHIVVRAIQRKMQQEREYSKNYKVDDRQNQNTAVGNPTRENETTSVCPAFA
jgi:hypothetical protein